MFLLIEQVMNERALLKAPLQAPQTRLIRHPAVSRLTVNLKPQRAQQGTKGRATEWLKNRLLNHKVKEYDASGNSTTL